MSFLADPSSSPVAEKLNQHVWRGGGRGAGVRGQGQSVALRLLLGDGAGDEADPAAGVKVLKERCTQFMVQLFWSLVLLVNHRMIQEVWGGA